jgi:Putative transposase
MSCKRCGFCPSCLGRRMSDSAVHLEQRVLPAVPIRHWIGSLPWGLRALLGYDRVLCAQVVGAFVEVLCRSLRRRAKRVLGLKSIADAYTGAVASIQRTDGAMRLNVHAPVLALDGVYVRDGPDGALAFHALPAPTRADVTEVARRTAARVERILRVRGRSLDPQNQVDDCRLSVDEPTLAAYYAAAAQGISVAGERAGKPTLRLLISEGPTTKRTVDNDEPFAEVRGINVHAKQLVDGRDRAQLERLCRYITRPPLAQERLTRRADGRLELELKKVWRDGTRALVLEPFDLLARLVASVPPPRLHLLRYFGVLSGDKSCPRSRPSRPSEDRRPRPVTSSAFPRSAATASTTASTTTPDPRATAGPGSWLMCFAPIWTPALAVVDPCAGSRPPSPSLPSTGSWLRTDSDPGLRLPSTDPSLASSPYRSRADLAHRHARSHHRVRAAVRSPHAYRLAIMQARRRHACFPQGRALARNFLALLPASPFFAPDSFSRFDCNWRPPIR